MLEDRFESVAGGRTDRFAGVVFRQTDIFYLREIPPIGPGNRFDQEGHGHPWSDPFGPNLDNRALAPQEVDLQAFFTKLRLQLVYNLYGGHSILSTPSVHLQVHILLQFPGICQGTALL